MVHASNAFDIAMPLLYTDWVAYNRGYNSIQYNFDMLKMIFGFCPLHLQQYLMVTSMFVQQRYNRFDVSFFDYVQCLRTLYQYTVKHF